MRALLAAFVLLLLSGGAFAQDQQTDDHAEQDRRYLERLLQEQKKAEEQPEGLTGFDALLAMAEKLVKDQNYDTRSSDHYRIQTDDPNINTRKALALLDGHHAFFEKFFAGRLELGAQAEVGRVFLFDSFHKYNKLLGTDLSRSDGRPAGHYLGGSNMCVMHTRSGDGTGLEDTLVHEATHLLVDMRLNPRGAMSPWISEGLATFFQYVHQDDEGTFHPSRIGDRSVRIQRESNYRRGNARNRLSAFKRAFRKGDVTVSSVVEAIDPGQFYQLGSAQTPRRYEMGWLLIHYLLFGDGGAHAGKFLAYFEKELAGEAIGADLYDAVGMDAEALGAGLEAHLKGLKAE
ncbi:hypothetical protein ABI59_02490 [Acidobacteria bacterium Mor1]|nr:hypothetical protein ABI59_02490 [Acidobacteria bacterium Mor1]